MDKTYTVYQTISLLNGIKVEMIMPSGWDYVRAIHNHRAQSEYSIELFMMTEFCRVDGKKQPVSFYGDLMCDDFMRIFEVLASMITPNK